MKKILITAFAIALAVPAMAAQQEITVVPASPAQPSIGALKAAINQRLADADENFNELYTAVGTRPWVIQATAPADTTLAWFDTDQVVDAVVLKIHNGERWVPQAIGEGGSHTIPTAAADTLGGVKVGDRLSIADGVLSADIQTTDISGKENSLGNPSVTGYVLSSTTAGVRSWIEMTGGGTGIAHAPSDGNYYASKDGAWATLAGVFQPADADLTSAAGGSAAGNSKLFGTNSSGVVGWYDIPGEGSGIAHATADGKWYGSKDGAWVDLAPTFSSALPKWIDMSVGYTFTAGDLTWYNGQVWKASGTHSKVLGEYPNAESTDWEDYVSAPVVVYYPTAVGVPSWTAEGWAETSYTVGTAASNLVQLNASAQLPAVSGALLTNIPLPSWLPSAAPPADNMIIQATGGCSNIAYTDQATCEANSGTWTPPVGAWTSIIDGLINDAGAGADDLLSAIEINTRISSAGAFYQVADGDLNTAAGASAAGNSKLFGTNASGVVGWYDIPVDTDTDDQTASEVGFAPNGSIAATTVQAAVQEVRDEAEPVLGNPAANGYVLSSTTAGTRSWIAQSSGGSVDLTAPGPIGSVTPNTGAFTTLVADSFDFTAPVAGTTGEIGLQEDPTNGASLVTLKAPASLATDLVFTLPAAYPATSGSVLESTTTGALSWSAKYVTAPITATDTCTAGQQAYASGFLYVCIATNTWKRAAMATW